MKAYTTPILTFFLVYKTCSDRLTGENAITDLKAVYKCSTLQAIVTYFYHHIGMYFFEGIYSHCIEIMLLLWLTVYHKVSKSPEQVFS